MIQLVIGAAAGYVFGTKAGRRRYEQIRRGYEAAVNSPATKRAVRASRKALADRLDPEPRMRELRDVRGTGRAGELDGEQDVYLEDDALEHEEDVFRESEQSRMRDAKGRPVSEQDGQGGAARRRRFGRR